MVKQADHINDSRAEKRDLALFISLSAYKRQKKLFFKLMRSLIKIRSESLSQADTGTRSHDAKRGKASLLGKNAASLSNPRKA